MFNVSEEMTVKARQRHARTLMGLFIGAAASGAFATVNAQTQTLQRGQTAGPRFMVPTFRSSERGLGLQAAEAVRERMGQDFQLKTLWIVPKSDIMTTLVNSGYSTTEALSSNDARALAHAPSALCDNSGAMLAHRPCREWQISPRGSASRNGCTRSALP